VTRASRDKVVAVAGATGAVGEVLLRVLEERAFPVAELRPLASERSAGAVVRFRGTDHRVEVARPAALDGADFVFFAATGTLSKELAPEAAERGAVAIDKSSTWRMTEGVPLVVPTRSTGTGGSSRVRTARRSPSSWCSRRCTVRPASRASW